MRPVEYADHDDFVAILVEFMNDDVRQARHRPFIGAGDDPDAAELGELAEPIGLGKDAFGDVDCRLGAALLYIKADAGDECVGSEKGPDQIFKQFANENFGSIKEVEMPVLHSAIPSFFETKESGGCKIVLKRIRL